MVPRCSEWVAWLSRQSEVELAGEQIDHGLEVSRGAVAAGFGLGRLDQAVDALDQPVGDLAVEPTQDAVPVALDGACGLDHRFEPAVGGPEVPLLQESGGRLGGGLLIEVLEGQPDLIGARRLQMMGREVVEGGLFR